MRRYLLPFATTALAAAFFAACGSSKSRSDSSGDGRDAGPDSSSAGAAGGTATGGMAGAAGIAGTNAGGAPAGGASGMGGTAGVSGMAGSAGTGGMRSPLCGNAVVDPGENCDDGNRVDGDACPDGPIGTCQLAACGDGARRIDVPTTDPFFEQCDPPGNGCDSNCQLETNCGDGQIDGAEQCDNGANNTDFAPGQCPDTCRTNCQCPACGDGVTDFVLGEQCDDDNLADGDGCSSTCQNEPITTCGNGTLDFLNGEECDDGGTDPLDGCSPTCQLEAPGALCPNDMTEPPERCDDDNTANGDGCNPTCNFTGTVTTLNPSVNGTAMTADDQYLWFASCQNCSITRIEIDDCLNNGNCTPTPVAGTGGCAGPTVPLSDGPGDTAGITCIETLESNGQTVWFSNRHTVRALDATTFDITTIAGDETLCAAIDGVGPNALFHDIRSLTHVSGELFLLDGCENTLRRLDPTTGRVVTLAGQRIPDPTVAQMGPLQFQCRSGFACTEGNPADGFGLTAVFGSPRYMAHDNAGNLFIADTNGSRLRRYGLHTGYVATIAGGPVVGYLDGPVATAELEQPRGMISDGASLYFGEQMGHTIRQTLIATGETSTLVGVRGCAGTADGTGSDASQDWSFAGCGMAPTSLPTLDTPLGALEYHSRTRSIFSLTAGRLVRIQ